MEVEEIGTRAAPALDALEARVLGVLIEKELTTPDQYPLSMNALLAGCNQKSNRFPEMLVSEAEARLTLDGLFQKHLASIHHPATGRVERYGQSARETLSLVTRELAVLAEMLLRGPQQRGELRTRASRMAALDTQEDLAATLESLARRKLVTELPPAPGGRAPRVTQLLTPLEEAPAPAAAAAARSDSSAARPSELGQRVAALEQEVAELRGQLRTLAAKLGESLG